VSTPRTLREVDFPPFAYVIKTAHPAAVMPSYNEIDGVPSHANAWLLHDVLRGEFGFTGLIVSDYEGVRLLADGHHVAGSLADAGALALRSGVQLELPKAAAFPGLKAELAAGRVNPAQIDAAVGPILEWKFRLGLFEHPYADLAAATDAVNAPSRRALALQAARESIVLLKNDGLLPLSDQTIRTIAVIGPNADVARLGSYSGTPLHAVSLLDGIRARVGDRVKVIYAPGCVLDKDDRKNAFYGWKFADPKLATDAENQPLVAAAAAAAASADVVVLAIGEDEALSREAWDFDHLGDAATLELRGSQRRLAEAVLAAGKPVVVFLSNARPLSIGFLKERAQAILEGWYAGQETGTAAAEILFGDTSPSGKLTVSFPVSVGQIPAYYSKKPYAGVYAYQFSDNRPLWPFGFGMSYTTFRYENARLRKSAIGPTESTEASVDVVNTGPRAADEIVQLYVHQDVSSVTRAVKALKGFQRIHLQPGERRTVAFPVTPDALAIWDLAMRFTVEPGTFQIILGPSSDQGTAVTLTVRNPS
jgi:beta-glucosidase